MILKIVQSLSGILPGTAHPLFLQKLYEANIGGDSWDKLKREYGQDGVSLK